MTEQEAIEILRQDTKILSEAIKEANLERVKNVLSGRVEANNVAIKALEKQIPKKPIHKSDKFINFYKCPECNNLLCTIYNDDIEFCDKCGQAIDWGEEE